MVRNFFILFVIIVLVVVAYYVLTEMGVDLCLPINGTNWCIN